MSKVVGATLPAHDVYTVYIFIRDLRIGNFRSNRIANRIGGYDSNSNLESNQGVVVYVFNADCHRSFGGLLHTTDEQRCEDSQWFRRQDRSYSASECVCSWYINIKS